VVGVALQPVALASAEKIVDRDAERLALDVEQRRLDRAERAAEDRAGPPVVDFPTPEIPWSVSTTTKT
jgi:hypothetical protein